MADIKLQKQEKHKYFWIYADSLFYRYVILAYYFYFLWSVHHSMLVTWMWQEYYRAWFLELSFSRISESTTGYKFTPCGIFYFPWHRHQIEGTISFYCLFRKTQAMWGERNCLSFKMAAGGLEPFDWLYYAITIPHNLHNIIKTMHKDSWKQFCYDVSGGTLKF